MLNVHPYLFSFGVGLGLLLAISSTATPFVNAPVEEYTGTTYITGSIICPFFDGPCDISNAALNWTGTTNQFMYPCTLSIARFSSVAGVVFSCMALGFGFWYVMNRARHDRRQYVRMCGNTGLVAGIFEMCCYINQQSAINCAFVSTSGAEFRSAKLALVSAFLLLGCSIAMLFSYCMTMCNVPAANQVAPDMFLSITSAQPFVAASYATATVDAEPVYGQPVFAQPVPPQPAVPSYAQQASQQLGYPESCPPPAQEHVQPTVQQSV